MFSHAPEQVRLPGLLGCLGTKRVLDFRDEVSGETAFFGVTIAVVRLPYLIYFAN